MSLRRIMSIIAILLVLVFTGFGLALPQVPLVFALASGAAGSIIASVVWSIFGSRELGGQRQILDSLSRLEEAAKSRDEFGVTLVSEKAFNDPLYWARRFGSANGKILLMGYALSTLAGPSYRPVFVAAVERVIRAGGDFCVVMMDPEGTANDAVKTSHGRDQAPLISETLLVLKDVHDRLPEELRSKVEVKFLEAWQLPNYMTLITDAGVHYSPYFMRVGTRATLHTSMDATSELARIIEVDYQRVRERVAPVDITSVLDRISPRTR